MRPRAIAFDLDGTLIDSDRDIAEAVNAARVSLGRAPLALEVVRGMIGHGARHLLASALAPDDDALIERARAAFIAHYRAHPADHTLVFPGVRECLAALRDKGLALAVATNKPAEITRRVLEALDLPLASASADEVPARKPDPAVLALALARAGAQVAPAEVVYVGDMGVDVETARRFGARSVAVSWGFSPETARGAGPDAWIEEAAELIRVLERWS